MSGKKFASHLEAGPVAPVCLAFMQGGFGEFGIFSPEGNKSGNDKNVPENDMKLKDSISKLTGLYKKLVFGPDEFGLSG